MRVITTPSLLAALGDLFNNPDQLRAAADEIDCGPSCPHLPRDDETNAAEFCNNRLFCRNDLSEMLKRLAELSERDGKIS